MTLASIPPDIARDWLLPDGRARVQVAAEAGRAQQPGPARFVAEVTAVAPNAGGSAVTIVETARPSSARSAPRRMTALAAITVILFLALRRPLDVSLVLAPLLLSSLLT